MDEQARRLVLRAVRRLPRKLRPLYQEEWLGELLGIESSAERLAYAQGLREAAWGIRREHDPEEAFVGDVMRVCLGSSVVLILLSGLGVAPDLLRLLSHSIVYGFIVLVLSHLAAKSVLILPELRRVWWRLGAMTLLGLTCGFFGLALLAWWSALHPQALLLLVAFVALGIYTARRFHIPRAPRAR
ncbi:hypothetical protein QOL99_15425 [Deinococcus sp. MIMF12]|uniref:DUF1129 domain-containing protein n=1 Tax=Deinococcus rhizophilus TaxID=3049544 RepID=A0ABT7JPF9_9DEIO|nr:hypothetical protein [Deinococcus rhizophilus]MDL2345529.1 hypothetical protein [Deinococcus rhizophilus]